MRHERRRSAARVMVAPLSDEQILISSHHPGFVADQILPTRDARLLIDEQILLAGPGISVIHDRTRDDR